MSVPAVLSRGLKGSPAQGLVSATLGFFVGFAAVSLFGPTAQKIKALMGLDPVRVGFLVAVPSLSGSLLRIPFSAWVDTTGGRKPFLVLLSLSIMGMAGLWLVVHFLYPERMGRQLYPLLLLLGVLCGCGIATFSVGIGKVAYWFPKARHGTALGIFGGVGNVAPGIFTLFLPIALQRLGLAGSYAAWLAFLAAGTVVYFVIGRNAWYFQLLEGGLPPEEACLAARELGQEIFPAGSVSDSLRISAGIWKTWALVAVYFTTFGGFIALTAWLPFYWSSFFSTGPVLAGTLTAAYSILTSLFRVGGGFLSDRLGGEKTAAAALLLMLGGASLMTASHSFPLSVAAEVLLALAMGVANAAVFKLVAQEVPQAVGGAAGWVGGLGAFGGFAIPPAMGAVARAFGSAGYARGFAIFVGLAALSIAMVFCLRRARPRQVPA